MSSPSQAGSGRPAPEKPDQIYVEIAAEEDLTVRPRQPLTGAGENVSPPAPDQLAGISVVIEAPEDLTVRPRQPVSRPGGSSEPAR